MSQNDGVPPTGSGYSAEPEPCSTVSAVPVSIPNAEECSWCEGNREPGEICACNAPNAVTIPGELYAFLMGEGPLEGVWFGELNKGLRGAFWWRALLRCAAGWPASAIEARRAETHSGSVHESAVAKPDAHNQSR